MVLRIKLLIGISLVSIICSLNLMAQQTDENLPMYGGTSFSKEEIAANEEFVKETTTLYGTKEKAFITFVNVGWKGIIENKLNESIQDFNKAWLLFPEHSDSYFGFSLIMQLSQKQAEADKLFNKGIVLDKDKKAQMKYYLRATDFAGRKKDTVLMIRFLNQSLSVDSTSIQGYKKLAYFTSLIGMNKEAILAYSAAIRISTNDSSLYFNRGLTFKKMQKFNEAISDFTFALNLSKNKYFESTLNRGIAKYEIGDYNGSVEDYNACIKMNSKTAMLYRFLGISLIMTHDDKGACNAWKTAKKLGDIQAEELYNAQCK